MSLHGSMFMSLCDMNQGEGDGARKKGGREGQGVRWIWEREREERVEEREPEKELGMKGREGKGE